MGEANSHTVTASRGPALPEPARPVGYSALIERYRLEIPLPPRMAAAAARHHPVSTQAWQLFTPRHMPQDTLTGQLEFALGPAPNDRRALRALAGRVAADSVLGDGD